MDADSNSQDPNKRQRQLDFLDHFKLNPVLTNCTNPDDISSFICAALDSKNSDYRAQAIDLLSLTIRHSVEEFDVFAHALNSTYKDVHINAGRNLEYYNGDELAKLVKLAESHSDKKMKCFAQIVREKATIYKRQYKIHNIQPIDDKFADIMSDCAESGSL